VVVVAGDDHQLAAGERPSEILEQRLRGGERFAWRAVTQLEHVAEQHHAVHLPRGRQQWLAQLRAPQQIRARDAPQVQV
jgi:hypothetical protein